MVSRWKPGFNQEFIFALSCTASQANLSVRLLTSWLALPIFLERVGVSQLTSTLLTNSLSGLQCFLWLGELVVFGSRALSNQIVYYVDLTFYFETNLLDSRLGYCDSIRDFSCFLILDQIIG